MARGSRLPAIARGIYPDRFGFEVRVPKCRGAITPKRYPPQTPLEVMQQWQADEYAYYLRTKADDDAETPAPVTRGTLSGDVITYLQTRIGRDGYKADRSHLHAWELAFGSRPRHRIKRHDCEKQISAWIEKKKAPCTIKHRVRVLKELWHNIDGPRARTPVDGVKLPRIVKTIPTPVSEDLILRVADSLQRGLTKPKACGPTRKIVDVHFPVPAETHARFLIRALSGQRPSQVARAKPEHIDRARGIWWVQAGKGGHPVPFPLFEELDLAFQYFDKVKAWGAFDVCSFSKTIKRHGWPADVKPYVMRHNFAITQLLAGTDLGDLQGLLGHTNPTTTRVYAPVLVARLKEAVARGSTMRLVKRG